ncbi:RDD family protein [Halobacillus yeomjeoni]|uniref:RDD family protein n=1 Tax=Halobacillus yeomjeoni TaxID=311194 RepID=A0A931MUU1_9BACI|nr:RDD family protein [Halobacillus yeomjeoni]MBH0229681.1 RDD family protein [Halobacillus yeomjeoni]
METIDNHPQFSIIDKHKADITKLIYAGFGIRFFAYIIDLLIVWSVNSIIIRPLIRLLNIESAKLWIEMLSAENILTSIIFFLYFILMTKYFRATLGKMIFGLSVESLNGKPLSNGQIIFREFIGRYISMAVFGLPYLVVAFTKRHQGVHDLFADTSVIKNRFQSLYSALEHQEEANES